TLIVATRGDTALHHVGVARDAVKSSYNNQCVPDCCSASERMGHIGIWPSAPAIAKRIVDISAVVGGLRGIGRRMQHPWSLEALWSLETAPNERVATTHQIAIRADRSRVWSINVNRHRRNGCPAI